MARTLWGLSTRNLKSYGQAADRAQAVLELAPDGTVVTANERFLALTGYRLDDLQGKPHHLFCDPAEVERPESRAVWEAVRRGEPAQHLTKWLGKDGTARWLAASLVPLGSAPPRTVIMVATDVTTLVTELETVKEELAVRQA
ncbi:MAG: PAS domain-containing protein, partial [Nitrospira sp.]|nr:PAS domain-containing protein [Nitrospira sp.]